MLEKYLLKIATEHYFTGFVVITIFQTTPYFNVKRTHPIFKDRRFFGLDFTARQDYFTNLEPSQSVGGGENGRSQRKTT